ncbi:MAG: hypothetical protein ACOYBE_01815 [Blautia sp.]|jgi:hypothetical protein
MSEEMFKTTLMGGFDKEDVLTELDRIKTEAREEQERLMDEIVARDEKIAHLQKRLDLKDDQYARLEQDVREKYQKYVDNYESIGKLVFEAQIHADEILAKAKKDSEEIRNNAQAEADSKMAAVQAEVDEKLAEGKKRYIAVQEEMNEIVELINQAQNRFMESYKEVHRIVSAMPESLREIEEEEEQEIGADQELVDHMESILGVEDE